MEILKTATEWAKAEIFSSSFFILFGILFILATLGFWQLGKTELSKAFVIPTMVCGVLLLTIGLGLVYSNKVRVSTFPKAYQTDASAFLQSEIARAEKTMKEYNNIVFKVIPLIITLAAICLLFMDRPNWRATCITIIAMMVVILIIDSNANARMEAYHKQITTAEGQDG